MYRAVGPSARTAGDTVRVVLVLDVPAYSAESAKRAAELADQFGSMVGRLLPGVRAHKALVRPVRPESGVARRDLVQARPDGLLIDVPRRLVTIDGAPIRVTYREFELLRYVIACAGSTASRAELMREVWHDVAPRLAENISERTVDTHIRRLRAKLGGYERLLVTVRGRGYRFEPAPDVTITPVRTPTTRPAPHAV